MYLTPLSIVLLTEYACHPLEGPQWIRVTQLFPVLSPQYPLKRNIIHLNRVGSTMSIHHLQNHHFAVSYIWGQDPVSLHNLLSAEFHASK